MDDIILNVKKSIEEIQQLHWTSIMDFPFYLINLINRSYSTDAVKDNRLKKKSILLKLAYTCSVLWEFLGRQDQT